MSKCNAASFPRSTALHPDRRFAEAVLPLLIESAVYAGFTSGETHELPQGLAVFMHHPARGTLRVMLGHAQPDDHRPNQGRWAIRNQRRWRRTFCALQDKLFLGRVPGWLRPSCTGCGRRRP